MSIKDHSITIKVKGGDVKMLRAKLSSLTEGEEYIVSIQSASSDGQKKLYFKFLNQYASHLGVDVHSLHDSLKKLYNPDFLDLVLVTESGSVKNIGTEDLSNYIEQCFSKAAEDGFIFN